MCLFNGIAGMKENDITGMRFADDAVYDRLNALIHPILRIGIPLDHFIAKLVGNFQHAFIKIPIRQPKQGRCFSGQIG